jgi:asparagine synthase (glutamine-hydrolysing)
MGEERAREVLADFSPESWIGEMSGTLPGDPVLALAQIESTTYLRNQLLRDSDWASMDHSVELRTPLVDAWLLKQLQPMLASFERYPKKQLLSQAPGRHLSDDVALRAKTGFGIPIQHWLASAGLAGRGEGSTRGWGRYLAQHLYAA